MFASQGIQNKSLLLICLRRATVLSSGMRSRMQMETH